MNRFSLAVFAVGLAALAPPAWGQVIDEERELLASDGASQDGLGSSIAMDNGIVAIGAPGDADNNPYSGSAYLFDALTGAQLFKLVPDDGAAFDAFGWCIAIDDGIVAVGAHRDDDNGQNSGSAYLFDAETGAQIVKLFPTDATIYDRFGSSIAISNGVVAVGAVHDDVFGSNSGSAYLFDVSTGAQIAKLLPSDGGDGDVFGCSIAIDGGVVAVGSDTNNDDNGFRSGAVYLFDVSTGIQFSRLTPSDGVDFSHFGSSVAMDDGVIAIGAFRDGDDESRHGSAYIFDVFTGNQIAKLIPNDARDEGEFFGSSIAIDNGIVVVGAYGKPHYAHHSGAAYFFDSSTGNQIAKLLPGHGGLADRFGWSVAIEQGVAAIGALNHDGHNGSNAGAAFIFRSVCQGDCDGSSTVDFNDLVSMLFEFGNNTGDACDADGSGTVDFNDLVTALFAFGPCP